MKVVFLDFDYVLNTVEWLEGVQSVPYGSARFPDNGAMLDPTKIALVQQICRRTGAVVVLSTAWRTTDNMEELRGYLRRGGLEAAVIDRTPRCFSGHRGREIEQWIEENVDDRDTFKFVILDDRDDMEPNVDRLVQTSPYGDEGLLPEHVERAVGLLGEIKLAPEIAGV